MIKKILFVGVTIFIGGLIFLSCKKEEVSIPAEPVKEINGSWKIIKALRNGVDMTARFDFSKFRINFSDSNYTISNLVPFIVNANGAWKFDDPEYPFVMSFQANGDTLKTSAVQYPVVKGVRNIVISFSPGCQLNTYQYTLEKEN